jgi:hypothetical protein
MPATLDSLSGFRILSGEHDTAACAVWPDERCGARQARERTALIRPAGLSCPRHRPPAETAPVPPSPQRPSCRPIGPRGP